MVKPFRMKMHSTPHSMARQFTLNYLIVSIIPVLFLVILAITGTKATRDYLGDLIFNATYDLNRDAENSLQALGERFIDCKATDVAKQIEIYFRTHPSQDIRQMRQDPFFMQLAVQKVGETGYTAIIEAQTHHLRVHPNPELINQDLQQLAEQMPALWNIIKKAETGKSASGYYDWIEPDGSRRRKYMAMAPIQIPFEGVAPFKNVTMMVAATTYIKEFSLPIVDMQYKAETTVQRYRDSMSGLWSIFIIIALWVIVLAFCGTYFLGRRVGFRFILPIVQLAETARQYGEGQWDARSHEKIMARKDEIGTLAHALSKMSEQLKGLFGRLERQLAELKKTQRALKQSEAHYRSLYDGVPVGLYRSAPDGSVLSVNKTLVRMLGFSNRKSVLARKAEDMYVDVEDRERWQRRLDAAPGVYNGADNGVCSFDTRVMKKDGTRIYVENQARAVRNADGKVIYYEGSLKDTTERRLAEEAVKKSEARFKKLYKASKQAEEVYRSLIRSSADAIMICDLDLRATYTSPMFTRIFGWTTEELQSNAIPFIPESEKKITAATFRKVIEKGTPCQGFETKRTSRDGRLIEVNISSSRYDDHAGKPAGLLVMLRDVSEKKRLEAQLQHIERMEAIGTLAGGIAHDFNNLLMAIQGSITLIRDSLQPSHPNFELFDVIEKQIESGAGLTRQLLGYARKGKYEVRPVDLGEILKESAKTLQRTRKDITIHYDLGAGLHPVAADVNQIEQVLMNLFINASDAMSEGGNLFLSTRNVSSEAMVNKAYSPKPGQYVMLEVRDDGAGMDQKTMSRIFDPFFTTKEMGRGTGLGLASAYGIVKGHGGYIDVDSEPGQGTTFYIYLPATQQAAQKTSGKRRKATTGSGTILLVDDEALVLDVGAAMLGVLGYTVHTAGSGSKAIEVFKTHKKQIDLVLLDMIMPEMSGSTTFDKLKEIDPDVPVLLSSGYSIDGKASEIVERGCNGFIQKPYSIEKLSEKIKTTLQKDGSE